VVASLALASCGRSPSDLEACLAAEQARDLTAASECESAWDTTFDPRAAAAGAHLALIAKDDLAMLRWAPRATNDSEGARVQHFCGALHAERGDVTAAEASFRRALALRIDREPLRAVNTASSLFDLIRNRAPIEDSVKLLRIAWHQASLADDPLGRAMAASELIELLVDFGDIQTAETARPSHRCRAGSLVEGPRGRSNSSGTWTLRDRR